VNLPADLSGDDLRRALERIGFAFQRQKGSHMIRRRAAPYARVVVPAHRRRTRPGTLRQILHEAGLNAEELKKLR
jgi:predicted RNA binding protein YcfA (HicA-like mRNA interferase family)